MAKTTQTDNIIQGELITTDNVGTPKQQKVQTNAPQNLSTNTAIGGQIVGDTGLENEKEGWLSKAWHGLEDFIGVSSPEEREKEQAAAYIRNMNAYENTNKYMNTELNWLKQTDFAVDDKSLTKLKGFYNNLFSDDELIKENINKAGGKIIGGSIEGLNQSGITKFLGKDVDSYYKLYNQTKQDLLDSLKNEISNLAAKKRAKGEKITEADIEDIITNNDNIKDLANKLTTYKRILNNNINLKIYDKTIGQENWISKAVHTAEVALGELTTDFITGFQGIVDIGNKVSKTIGDLTEKIPYIGKPLSLPTKGLNTILDYEERAQSALGGLEARLNNKGLFGNIERIGMPVVGFLPNVAPLLAGGLGSIRAAKLFEDIFTTATKSEAAGKLLGLSGGTLIGTDMFLDGVVNTITQTAITPKQVQADMFYNALFGAVGEGILGAYRLRKQYIDKKLENEILNKTITVNVLEKGSDKVVQKQLRLGDMFDNMDEVIGLAVHKGKANIEFLNKYLDEVEKKIHELTTQGNEKDILNAKRVFNKKIALWMTTANKDYVQNALRANKTRQGTEAFFEKAKEALRVWIEGQKKMLQQVEEDLAKEEAHIKRIKEERLKQVQDSIEQQKKENIAKITTVLTALKTATSRKMFQDYMDGLNKIEINTKEGIRKVEINPQTKAKIEYDVINHGQIQRDTINNILKDVNKSLLGQKGTVDLSDYLTAIKKFLGKSKDYVDDDLKLLLSQSEDTIDAYNKLINTVIYKDKPQIGKTSKDVGAMIDLTKNLIKLGKAYKDFGDIAEFGVVLTHELTHLSEPALRKVWGDELVNKLKDEWQKIVETFEFANKKEALEQIEPFKSKQEIIKYLDEYQLGEHLDSVVDFNIRLRKSVREGYITEGEMNEFLVKFSDIKDAIDNNLLIKATDDAELLKKANQEADNYTQPQQYEELFSKRISIIKNMEKRLKYIEDKKIKDPKKLEAQKNKIAQEKEKIIEDIMQTYNVDKFKANEIYNEIAEKISENDLNILKDPNLTEILYEITSTDLVNGRYRGFSEYLAYLLSNKLIKGDIEDNNIFKKFIKGIEVGGELIKISPENLKKAGQILLEKKFKGLEKYVITELKDTHNVLYTLKKSKNYKNFIEYVNMVDKNMKQALENPSVDSILHYLSTLNEKDFIKQVYSKGVITQKELKDIIKTVGFDDAKQFIGNGLLLGLKGKEGVIAGGMWEGMVRGAKGIVDYKMEFRRLFTRQFTEDQLQKLPEKVKKIIFDKDSGINDYLANIHLLVHNNAYPVIIRAVGYTLQHMYEKTIHKASGIFDKLLKIGGLTKQEKEVLENLKNIYYANENYYMYKLLNGFISFGDVAFDNLIKEKPLLGGIYRKLGEAVKIDNDEMKILISNLYKKLGKEYGKLGVVDLGYILRIGRSGKGEYDKINLKSVKNTTNLSLFNSIVNVLGYKTDKNVFNEFIQAIREKAIKMGVLPSDSFDINYILRLFGYEFKGTKKGLENLMDIIHNLVKKGNDIEFALDIAKNKVKGLQKVNTKTIKSMDLINYLILKANNSTTYAEMLKTGQFTFNDYIDLIFDVFDKDIAKGLANKILTRSRQTIIKNKGLDYFNGLKQYVNDVYNTYTKIDNDVKQALEDIGEQIDVMRGKYNDIPNELQRLNVHYSGIGGVETLSIINKNGIAFQFEKRDDKWVLLSKGNTNAFSINKTSPFTNIFNQSELDFKEGIDNIKNISSISNIKTFINNCL